MSGQTEICSKKVRGRAQRSLDMIEAMYAAAQKANPISGRGIAYNLFTAGLIPSMARNEMQRVYRLLKEAREEGIIPWDWIVDETREIERASTWDNPAEYARCVARSYRRDFWNQVSKSGKRYLRFSHRSAAPVNHFHDDPIGF
jgi:hypothetical protein